jgi:hypothetical protein
MARHRTLNLAKLVHAIPGDIMERYFERLPAQQRPQAWAYWNGDQLDDYLRDKADPQVAAEIREDLSCINDIAETGPATLVRTYNKFGLSVDQDRPMEQLAMVLFLDHPEAFEFAWSRHLLYAGSSRLNIYSIPPDSVNITPKNIESFRRAASDWFSQNGKGKNCIVRTYEDNGETVMVVRHGSYLRMTPFWNDQQEYDTLGYRPGLQDVVVFDPSQGLLQISATVKKDSDQYLLLFATYLAGNPQLAKEAQREADFSLSPLQQGLFRYEGNAVITGIELRQIRLKVFGSETSVVDITASNTLRALEKDLAPLSLNIGMLTYAKFKVYLRPPGLPKTTATFYIAPPEGSDVWEEKHADIILKYLEEQGVKLK